MAANKLSEDERITALEEAIPSLSRALGQIQEKLSMIETQEPGTNPFRLSQYGSAIDYGLFEQALSLLRTIVWRQPVPGQFFSPVANAESVCLNIEITNSAIGMGQDGRIEDLPPLKCVDLRAVEIGKGRATFILCCRDRDEIGDCRAEVNFIIHQAGDPDNIVYQEARTIKCRGSRSQSPVI